MQVLEATAREALESRGLASQFLPSVLEQMESISGPASCDGISDFRHLLWASIDNEDTRDIDQLAYAEPLEDGAIRLLVAVADVVEVVSQGSPVDLQALHNTVTVYTPGKVFSMLPLQLSNEWTSLGPDQDRRAMVVELLVDGEGVVVSSGVREGAVRNKAKLDYDSLSAWLEGRGPLPGPLTAEMQEQIRWQMEAGRRLGIQGELRGALEFETDRVYPVVSDGYVVALVDETKNIASEAVAHMMIAANMAVASFLRRSGFPVFQRFVDPPQRWDRMYEVALQSAQAIGMGPVDFPPQPDPRILSKFLRDYKQRSPEDYPALTTTILQLMGGGDYAVTPPDLPLRGHFGQGIDGGEIGYVHSTAPNRRYPDVIIQRLVKAALRGQDSPYTYEELEAMARQCNLQESASKGAERQVRKVAIAKYLATRVGEEFNAVVTGNKPSKGVFVKVVDPPIEGKLLGEGDIGDILAVRLQAVDIRRGWIDFVPVS